MKNLTVLKLIMQKIMQINNGQCCIVSNNLDFFFKIKYYFILEYMFRTSQHWKIVECTCGSTKTLIPEG